jgi:hypothetical protein
MSIALCSLIGCDGASKDECESALELVQAHTETDLAKAESQSVKRALTNMKEQNAKYFVSECRKLDAAGKACVARTQEFLTKGDAAQLELADCYTPELDVKAGCEEKIKASTEAVMGDCGPPLNALQLAISTRWMPEWRAKQAAEKEG